MKGKKNQSEQGNHSNIFKENAEDKDTGKHAPRPKHANDQVITPERVRVQSEIIDQKLEEQSFTNENASQEMLPVELTPFQLETLDLILHQPLSPDQTSEEIQRFERMIKEVQLEFLPSVNFILKQTASDLNQFFLQRSV